MSDEHGFKAKIDCVTTAKPYPCGLCNRVHPPSRVVRLTNVTPDFHMGTGPVDILICEGAVEHMGFVMWAEAMDSTPEAQAHRIEYSPDELMALDREREELERFSPGLTD